LRNQPGRGRRPKLSDEQRKRLPELLQRGAESYGIRGDIWTNPRVAQVIRREFGISYHPAHVSRILEELGWTPQKPIPRAKQCKEEEVQKWCLCDHPGTVRTGMQTLVEKGRTWIETESQAHKNLVKHPSASSWVRRASRWC
jgi:hypothetical protein